MGLFKRKKKQTLEQVSAELNAQETAQEDAGKKNGSYVLDRCEQILEHAREIDDSKKEYYILTSYLNDIEIIENLSPDEANELQKAAESVTQLSDARDKFLSTTKGISDSQFQMIQLLEDEIPDAVHRMRENENYQTAVKRDMQYLEGEKQELEIRKIKCRRELKTLRHAACLLLAAVATVGALLVVLSLGWEFDTKYAWIATIAVAVAGAAAILIRQMNDRSTLRRADVNINYAISLLNKAKIKYVNITNAVDYAREKYHVRDARDLSYQWDRYQEMVREQERYRQTNEDLKYYYDALVGHLKKCRLYDARIWLEQPRALIEPREMVEIKHNLLVRRQKVRSKIAYNLEMVKKERGEIITMLRTHPEDSAQVLEMLQNIDDMSGLSADAGAG